MFFRNGKTPEGESARTGTLPSTRADSGNAVRAKHWESILGFPLFVSF